MSKRDLKIMFLLEFLTSKNFSGMIFLPNDNCLIIKVLSTEFMMSICHRKEFQSSDKGLTLETSAFKLFLVPNLYYQLT